MRDLAIAALVVVLFLGVYFGLAVAIGYGLSGLALRYRRP